MTSVEIPSVDVAADEPEPTPTGSTGSVRRRWKIERRLDTPWYLDAAGVLGGIAVSILVCAVLISAAGSPVLDRNPVARRWSLPGELVRAELPVGDFTWARRLVLSSAGAVVLRAPTGAGKTTRVPPAVLNAFPDRTGRIFHPQPVQIPKPMAIQTGNQRTPLQHPRRRHHRLCEGHR